MVEGNKGKSLHAQELYEQLAKERDLRDRKEIADARRANAAKAEASEDEVVEDETPAE